ncbi:hypothetical protein VNO77_04620 [Canavalia gladiata]|uniref:Uncharacterized protein n=1 Tax=Canavalia gladiata TaxID=3824 RepID=A0AAN9MWU6_CANGL
MLIVTCNVQSYYLLDCHTFYVLIHIERIYPRKRVCLHERTELARIRIMLRLRVAEIEDVGSRNSITLLSFLINTKSNLINWFKPIHTLLL